MGEVLESELLLSDQDDFQEDVMVVAKSDVEPEDEVMQHSLDEQPSKSLAVSPGPDEASLEVRGKNCSDCAIFWMKLKRSWFATEAYVLSKLALPIILTFFFQQLLFFVNVLFVGHFDDKLTFDATALANSFVNVTGMSIIIGVTSAGDTLCPQSYGFKNYKRVGIILQRGIVILSVACLLISVVWLNSESLLLLLQQQPCVVRVSGQYARVTILALPGIVVSIMLQKYLQAQSVVWIFVVSGMAVTLVGIVICAALVVGAHLGATGAALAVVVAFSLQPLLLIGYIRYRGLHKKTWGGWSWQSLNEWGQFLKLGLPGFLMISFEWWTYEISVLVTGTIDKTQLAVNTILIQLLTFAFMIPLGIGTAASVRVGNELGAGHPLKAKRAAYTAVILDAVMALTLTVLLLATKDYIGRAFISDEDVIRETSRAMYPAACLLFMDHIQGTISGVLRGAGLQALAAVINFTVFYLIGLPIGISLALLADMGTLGMWIGLGIAATLQGSIFSAVLFFMNWKKQSERAKKNATDSNKTARSKQDEDSEVENHGEYELTAEKEAECKEEGSCQKDVIMMQHFAMLSENVEKDDGECDVAGEELEIEEVPLVSHQDVEEFTTTIITETSSSLSVKRTRLRLLLTKGSVFTVGILVLIIGAILAGVFPHGGSLESDCVVNNTCYCNNTSDTFRTLSLTADGFGTVTSMFEFNSTLSTSLYRSINRTHTTAYVSPSKSVL